MQHEEVLKGHGFTEQHLAQARVFGLPQGTILNILKKYGQPIAVEIIKDVLSSLGSVPPTA